MRAATTPTPSGSSPALAEAAKDEASKRYFDGSIIIALFRDDKLAQADKEIETFKKKYKENEEDIAAFELERGSFYFRKEDYPHAIKSLNEVSRKYDDTPSAPDAMYWIGKIYQATEKPQDAVKQFNDLMDKYPQAESFRALISVLAIFTIEAENWPESIKHYPRDRG